MRALSRTQRRRQRAIISTGIALVALVVGVYLALQLLNPGAPGAVTDPITDEGWRLEDFDSLELPLHGAGTTGPQAESCETEGLVIGPDDYPAAVTSAEPGTTILLTEGTYEGGLTIPAGLDGRPTTLKPYDCANVELFGRIEPSEHTVIAGLRIDSGATFTVLISHDSPEPMRQIVVRHNEIRGGEVESLRVARNVAGVDIIGNHLDGGNKRHVVKVHSEGSPWGPANVRIVNNTFSKSETGSGTDLFQAEGHQSVLLMNNSFEDGGGENGIDIKTAASGGSVLVARNYFEGSTIETACLLVQGDFADNVVSDNYFDAGCKVALGAHPEEEHDPWWRFEGNTIIEGVLQLRRSFDAEIRNNLMDGGELKLGLEGGDHPRDAIISGNLFDGVDLIDRVTPAGDDYQCQGNEIIDSTGDWSRCEE